jgi:hypothetical protein
MTQRLFVYGSLAPGRQNEHILAAVVQLQIAVSVSGRNVPGTGERLRSLEVPGTWLPLKTLPDSALGKGYWWPTMRCGKGLLVTDDAVRDVGFFEVGDVFGG